jgi:hypothetical protein
MIITSIVDGAPVKERGHLLCDITHGSTLTSSRDGRNKNID